MDVRSKGMSKRGGGPPPTPHGPSPTRKHGSLGHGEHGGDAGLGEGSQSNEGGKFSNCSLLICLRWNLKDY